MQNAENLSRNKAFSSTVDKGGLVVNPIRPSSNPWVGPAWHRFFGFLDGGPEGGSVYTAWYFPTRPVPQEKVGDQ